MTVPRNLNLQNIAERLRTVPYYDDLYSYDRRGGVWVSGGHLCVAKAFKLESDFETSILCCDFVKILVNPLGFTAFYVSHIKKSFIYKILTTLKVLISVWILVKTST